MKTVKSMILTVNPAESTVGALHPEACMRLLRRKVDTEGATVARRKSGGLLRALFGATSVSASRSRMMLVLRVLFGGFLIVHGVLGVHSALIESVFAMGVGMMVMMGVATRFVMTASGVCFAIMSGMAIEQGAFPQTDLLIAVMSVGIAMAGPGRYSLDALLRRGIFRSIRRYETRKLMQRRFSYRAYQYAHL